MYTKNEFTILNAEPQEYSRLTKIRIAVCVAACICVLVINTICAVFMNGQNKIALLTVNIVSDIVCGCFLVWFITEKIIPRVKLFRITGRQAETVVGSVEKISEETVRYLDFDCRQIYIDGRVFYVIDGGTITFEVGEQTDIKTVSGLVVAATRIEHE